MRHGSLFSGIGGFDLAAEWMGWENVFHCEWNPFGQRNLKYHFPNAESFNDITKTDFTKYANKIDILTGGFPCQPYSSAGKRKGKEDERHLWPEMLRAIREISPRFVVGENVRGLTNWNGGLVFDEVCIELEALGYQVAPCIIPACGVDAPHRRERVWFVAYAGNNGFHGTKDRQGNRKGNEYNSPRKEPIVEFQGCSRETAVESDAFKNTMRAGCLQREPIEKGTEIREFGDTCTGSTDRIYISARDASNTDSNGLNERNGNDEKQPSNGGDYALCDINKSDDNGNVADTDGIGLRGKGNGIGKSGFNGQKVAPNGWIDFPTQSPICGGDDGLPTKLDGITFSKWRNESIKAYGNAIVPQVAYEIFKAIEATKKDLD